MAAERLLGVDACKKGWVGIVLSGDATSAYFAPTIDGLVTLVNADGAVSVVAVDMPIGLPDRGARVADDLARKVVGPRGPSVFLTPVRAAWDTPDHTAASARNQELAGRGISRQAFGLKSKILEVDRWVRHARQRVIEVHPEVSFAHLAAAPLLTRKNTWAGAHERRQLLAAAGIYLANNLGTAGGEAAVDDILDAAAAAWTARRVAKGEAIRRPDPPERFSDGLEAAIWT